MNEQQNPYNSPKTSDSVEAAASVVAAYATRPDSTPDQIVGLAKRLLNVFSASQNMSSETAPALNSLAAEAPAVVEEIAIPAVPLEEAVSNDKVYCLCCGRGFTMLKRHLKSEHGLTDDEYRKKFGLPDGMPLVAPMYSKRKASFAKKVGLGKYHRGEDDAAGVANT